MIPWRWASSESGAATPLESAPIMKSIRSRSIIRCATRTATEASVAVSSHLCSMGRPSTPPLALNSSMARIIPRRSACPLSAKVPVASQVSPIRMGFLAWARAHRQGPTKATPVPRARPPLRNVRRVGPPYRISPSRVSIAALRGHAFSWTSGNGGTGGDPGEQNAAPNDLALRHEDHDYPLGAHRERMDGVREPRPEQGRDPLAVEEALDHHSLGLVAAVHLHEPPIVGPAATRRRRGRLGRAGEADDLGAARHGHMLQQLQGADDNDPATVVHQTANGYTDFCPAGAAGTPEPRGGWHWPCWKSGCDSTGDRLDTATRTGPAHTWARALSRRRPPAAVGPRDPPLPAQQRRSTEPPQGGDGVRRRPPALVPHARGFGHLHRTADSGKWFPVPPGASR